MTPAARMETWSPPSPSSIRSWIVAEGSRPKYVKTSPMSMSRSTTAVSWPVSSAIAVARLVVRKVLPVPPFEENTEMMRPRVWVLSWPPWATWRRFVAHTMARSTASRSSSVPWVMSTTSRMPARIAAGSSPFHVWSRTRTIAVPGAERPTNSASPRASASFTSDDSTRQSTDRSALISSSSAAVALCTQPSSSTSTSRARASCCRNDCGVPTATMLPSVKTSSPAPYRSATRRRAVARRPRPEAAGRTTGSPAPQRRPSSRSPRAAGPASA